jgi:hypothetical protein
MYLTHPDFIVIPIVFYIVVAAAHLDLRHLRTSGWLFDMDTADDPWYKFYTFYGGSIVPARHELGPNYVF